MGLELSRTSTYALRAMLHLTRAREDGLQKGRQVAEATGIPAAYLPQVLGALIRHRLVSSQAGPHGGYAVLREPDTVSLLDVVEAVEGPLDSGLCALREGACTPHDACSMHEPWKGAQAALVAKLSSCSLADLLTDTAASNPPDPGAGGVPA